MIHLNMVTVMHTRHHDHAPPGWEILFLPPISTMEVLSSL